MTDKIEPTASALIAAGANGGVFKRGAEAFTTSKAIAKHFGKRHANVLRTIERILDEAPEHKLNFEFMLDQVKIGNGATRSDPVYRLNRRAVALIVFGFTGAKALRWKDAFLDAFDDLLNEHHRRGQWDTISGWKAPVSAREQARRKQLYLAKETAKNPVQKDA